MNDLSGHQSKTTLANLGKTNMKKSAPALVGAILVTTTAIAGHHGDPHDGPVMNFTRIDAGLASGGHLLDGGLEELTEQGVKVVIDLRDKPPEGHGEHLAAEGIQYINVPVVWRSPELEDFEKFRAAMNENKDANILVQCQANYRASAFTYLYRVLEAGVPEAEARKSMNEIWEPEGTWAEYIDEVKATYDN